MFLKKFFIKIFARKIIPDEIIDDFNNNNVEYIYDRYDYSMVWYIVNSARYVAEFTTKYIIVQDILVSPNKKYKYRHSKKSLLFMCKMRNHILTNKKK